MAPNLTELLLAKGYEVHGLIRRASHPGGTRDPDGDCQQAPLHYFGEPAIADQSPVLSEIMGATTPQRLNEAVAHYPLDLSAANG